MKAYFAFMVIAFVETMDDVLLIGCKETDEKARTQKIWKYRKK